MKNDAGHGTRKLVNAETLLEILFEARSRPTLRTLRTWTKEQIVPCVRCGGLVFYDIAQVRAALEKPGPKPSRKPKCAQRFSSRKGWHPGL